ncbi:MAG TPA: PAS domain-containing protein [bacterium]|nr:PAS domain-containing protein [bacterium]
MKIQIAHPITSYFDATSQLLRAQGEDFHLTGATSLPEVFDSSAQKLEDVYVIDSILLRDEPSETLDQIGAMSRHVPTIVMIEESEEELAGELQERGSVTLLYKRKGFLTALAEAVRQSHTDHLRRLEEAARVEAEKEKALRLAREKEEAARAEAARLEALRTEAARQETARFQAEVEEAARKERARIQARREEEERAARERATTIREAAPAAPPARETESPEEGFFICDRRGRFLSANRSLQTMLNYAEEELLELSLSDLLSREEEQHLFNDIFTGSPDQEIFPIQLHFIDKVGERRPVSLKIRMLRDESREKRVIGFRGSVTLVAAERGMPAGVHGMLDQGVIIRHLFDLVQMSYTEPLNVLLKRIGEVVCQIFGFQRSTIALLDRRKKAYIKHAMVGYGENRTAAAGEKTLEVPEEVVDRLFVDKAQVKVIYYSQESGSLGSPALPLTQTELPAVESRWHPRDLALLRLADHRGHQFGYISIDEPLDNVTPARSTFDNLELFSQLVAMVIENYYRFSTIERRNRRLKQILINSNIFKLYLSLNELLKEVVWSVKFSLEFNLVSLVLISKKSGQLETKAVACDDRIKLGQIQELAFDLRDFSALLREEYRRGKSFLISSEEEVLRHFKQIYYGSLSNGHYADGWPRYALLLVPIKSREGKIIGFILADDPADGKLPTTESVHILEILANQVAIAIDNRMLYVQAKEKPQSTEPPAASEPAAGPDAGETDYPEENSTGLRRLVDRFLR